MRYDDLLELRAQVQNCIHEFGVEQRAPLFPEKLEDGVV
jgi:hypothetical protein